MNTFLRDRLALRQGVAGLVAQLTRAAAGLGIILVVREAGGSLSLAGAAAAAFLIAVYVVAIAPLIATPSFALMVPPLLLAGAALNPVITTIALLVEDHAGGAAAEAFGWQSTSLAMGAAGGNALAGPLAQHHGASAAFAAAAIAAAVAVLTATPFRARLGTGQPASPG